MILAIALIAAVAAAVLLWKWLSYSRLVRDPYQNVLANDLVEGARNELAFGPSTDATSQIALSAVSVASSNEDARRRIMHAAAMLYGQIPPELHKQVVNLAKRASAKV